MHRYRILVVEDDHAIRNGLADALAVSGYDVLSARDGYEAMEMIHAEEYDLAPLIQTGYAFPNARWQDAFSSNNVL